MAKPTGNSSAITASQDLKLAAQGNWHHAAKAGISLFAYGKTSNKDKPSQETGFSPRGYQLIVRLLFFIAVIATAGAAFSSECTMTPAPVDIKRIAHNRLIKSYVVDAGKLSLTALLKNGRALRLIHTGCEHSGAEVSMWLDSERPFSDTEEWIKEASTLVKIAFPVDIANDILNSIKSGDFKKETTETRVVISAAPSSFMTYTIVVSRAESGLLLTISFVLG